MKRMLWMVYFELTFRSLAGSMADGSGSRDWLGPDWANKTTAATQGSKASFMGSAESTLGASVKLLKN